MHTFVYPVKHDDYYDYVSLKYSLRSVDLFYPDNKVIIIGGKPKWLDFNQRRLAYNSLDPKSDSPYHNVMDKIEYAFGLEETFWLMNDDIILLEPGVLEMDTPCREHIYLKKRSYKDIDNSLYTQTLHKTFEHFPEGVDYDMHYPFFVERKKWYKMLREYPDRNYQYKSQYGNLHKLPYTVMGRDSKIKSLVDVINGYSEPVLSTYNAHERVKTYRDLMDSRFPYKSRFEK